MNTFPPPPTSSRRIALARWAERHDAGDSPALRLARRVVRFLLLAIREFTANALSLRAAALTYTVLLSLVPILAMSTAVVKGLGGDDHLRQAAYGYLEALGLEADSPPPATIVEENGAQPGSIDLGGHLRAAIDQLFDYVDRTDFAALGSFGVAGILVSVILVLGTIEEAMNVIWKAEGGRSLGRKLADYLTVLVLLPISVNLTFAAGALLQNPALLERIEALAPMAALQPHLLKMVPPALTTLTFLVLYLFFPNTKVRFFPALLGAAVAAFFWSLAQDLYLSLQIGVANYNTIYGSFATLPLFLIWLYLGWLFILGGAQLAYVWQNRKSCRLVPVPLSPAGRLDAAYAIFDAAAEAHARGQRLQAEDLPGLMPDKALGLIGEVLRLLQEARLLHLSAGDRRLLPGTADRRDGYRRIAMAVLGTDGQQVPPPDRSQRVIAAAVRESENLAGEPPSARAE